VQAVNLMKDDKREPARLRHALAHGEYTLMRDRYWLTLNPPRGRAARNRWRNEAILRVCDDLGSKLNIRQLARALVTENENLPEARRWGPRGTINPTTMETHIRRLLKARKDHAKKFAEFPIVRHIHWEV
jgi:hypothetical protein